MGNISANILNGEAPYAIVVRKEGENTGNRCIGACNNFPVDFTSDPGNNNYYFIVTDSNDCIYDSRGLFTNSLNCDVSAPSYNFEPTQIVCGEDEELVSGNIRLFNMLNVTRYKICYGSTVFNCTPCTDSTGSLTPGSETNIPITPGTPGTNTDFSIRVYNGSGCDVYSDINYSMFNPVCTSTNTPNFAAALIQPYCSTETGGTLQNAIIKLTDLTDATRYKLCYNSATFNATCIAGCASSDGVITGATKDIEVIPPAEGLSQNITLRVFNGSSCSYFKDYSFSIYSQRCSTSEVSMMNLDLQVFQNGAGASSMCDNNSTYHVEYDFYITPNTPGMIENGTQVKISSGSQRTLPSGNDVPNVYVAAGFKPVCGGSSSPGQVMLNMFYRFSWNMSYLKSKYPGINEFTFDVFANKTKDDGAASFPNSIRPYVNAFTGVSMVKFLYANNSNDAYRNPLYAGSACSNQSCPDPNDIFTNTVSTMSDVVYKTTVVGSRKIGSIKYNFTTNKVTWTAIPQ